jgi:hypothetical protein
MEFHKEFTMTIPDTQTDSNVIDLNTDTPQTLLSLLFVAPTLATTVTVHAATNKNGTFAALQSGAADVTLPSAKATPLTALAAGAIKLVSGSAVSGAKVFSVLAK